MQPILISFAIAFIGVIAAVILFSVAMRGRGEREEEHPPTIAPTTKGHFFLDEVPESEPKPHFPTDSLPLQVEKHVRLEHEAAEGFVRAPNADTLQAPSASDLKRERH